METVIEGNEASPTEPSSKGLSAAGNNPEHARGIAAAYNSVHRVLLALYLYSHKLFKVEGVLLPCTAHSLLGADCWMSKRQVPSYVLLVTHASLLI